MTDGEKISLTICWTMKGRKKVNRVPILQKFGLPSYMSVNHETPCLVDKKDIPLLEECQDRGFLIIRHKS